MSAATAEAAARVSDRDTAPPRDDGARRQRWKRLAWTWAPVWAVTLLGGLLRFWHLGRPHKLMFDETYYVKDAYSLLRRGVEFNWAEDANELFERGDFSGLEATGSYVVHPPVGKWLIAGGMWLFGPESSAGWRFSTALFGTAAIFLVILVGWRLFGSQPLGLLAGLLLAVDGIGITLSRTGLLDGFLMFFALLGFWLVLKDRAVMDRRLKARLGPADAGPAPPDSPGALAGPDRANRSAAPYLSSVSSPTGSLSAGASAGSAHALEPSTTLALGTGGPRVAADATGLTAFAAPRDGEPPGAPSWLARAFGPGLGMRWYLLGAGVAFGLACGVKWSGLFFLAVFGALVVAWDAAGRRRAGVRHWLAGAVWRDGAKAFMLMVPVALVVYTASWAGWLATDKGYGRDWVTNHPGEGAQWLPAPLRALVAYHQQAYGFHTSLTSEHSYQSNPALWLFQQRPTSFFYEDQPTCGVTACSQAVTALGNPLIWWLGVAALAVVLYNAVVWADRRCWAILMGYVGGYLPWLFYAERTIFTFYTVAFLPFVVLALAYAAGRLIGPAPHPPPVGGSGGEPAGRARLTVAPLAPAEAGGGGAAATAGLTADSGEAGNQDGGDGADSRSLADQLFAALANGSRPTGDGPDRGAPGDGATNASDGDSLAPFRVIVEPETAAVDPDPVPEGQRGIVVAVAVAVGLILLVSAFFWPIWSGQSVPYDFWRMHMWLPTWV